MYRAIWAIGVIFAGLHPNVDQSEVSIQIGVAKTSATRIMSELRKMKAENANGGDPARAMFAKLKSFSASDDDRVIRVSGPLSAVKEFNEIVNLLDCAPAMANVRVVVQKVVFDEVGVPKLSEIMNSKISMVNFRKYTQRLATDRGDIEFDITAIVNGDKSVMFIADLLLKNGLKDVVGNRDFHQRVKQGATTRANLANIRDNITGETDLRKTDLSSANVTAYLIEITPETVNR